MRSVRPPLATAPAKTPTGVTGFDEITDGGLPHGRTTLLVGGPGSGKTVLSLQFLAHGAHHCREPGIFVAFEETAKRILGNAESFGWNLEELQRKRKLVFLDAQPMPGLVASGDFDLGGMLAALEAQGKEIGAKRIVFDALDVVLTLLPDTAAKLREAYQLHQWLLARELTALVTVKAPQEAGSPFIHPPFDSMQFMVDCSVILNHSVVLGVSQRNLRVQKYRGSSFDENESPFIIGKSGLDVAVSRPLSRAHREVTNERVSSGVTQLDTMLGGGYFRDATVLITGSPGTGKTALGAACAQAACNRGERTLFVSFDSDGAEVIRGLAALRIRLDRHLKNGALRMLSARASIGSAETYLVRIKALAKEHGARCVVIDPISALSKSGNERTAHNVAERLIDWSKADGITLLCTSVLDEWSRQTEGGSPPRLAALADTWIHLNYLVQTGERNRGLSIIKSRGMAHSNQVRELILCDKGVTLADTYTASGEVLMGMQRWQKENDERVAEEVREISDELKRVSIDADEAELEVRMKALQAELVAKQVEKALLTRTTESLEGELSRSLTRRKELRGADAAKPRRKGARP
ncbi:MAG: circadian clock protein KaiC [Deferrisomatales bacterium]|nr:circadian clock protein KaiC [Deferrisomatales bacterium]